MTTKPTTERMREEFEAAMKFPPARYMQWPTGEYIETEVERAWHVWQAAYLAGQREGMERAADLCAQAWPSMQAHWGPGQARAACEDCAAAIRKLKDET